MGEIKCLKGELDYLLEQDTKWKQRAKQNWYQSGDRNTPFFHAWANHRHRINPIQKITDDEGRKWKKPEESKAFVEFYQKLFTTGEVRGSLFDGVGVQSY